MKQVESLRRGLAVLDEVRARGPLGLAAIADRTSLPRPTVLRLLGTLEATGHVRRGLGDRLWHATSHARQKVAGTVEGHLAEIAAPILDRLCSKVSWPSDVGIYRAGSIRVLETSRRLSPFLVNRAVAAKVHVLPTAMGQAILAFTSDAERAGILSDLRQSTDVHDLRARDPELVAELLAQIRANGYGARERGYFSSVTREALVNAVALPIMAGERALAAINVSWVASAMPEPEFCDRYLSPLRDAAAQIAEEWAAQEP